MYYKHSPTSILLPLYTWDENVSLACEYCIWGTLQTWGFNAGIAKSIKNSMHIVKWHDVFIKWNETQNSFWRLICEVKNFQNNHIFPKLQTLKSCSFLYSSSSYGYIFFVLNLGIEPPTHKPINFFLSDGGIAWLAHKSRWYLVAICNYCMNHWKTNPYFLIDASIAWFAHKSK
jgi:hypothetical protein